jgi:hypothetical protein
LGTLDHAVNLLWVTAHEGFSYVPDPFHTSRPDAELELRFASFCKMLHIGTPVYRALVRDWPAHTYWISGAKYSIHPLYQFSPLVDYTPAEQAKITTLPLTTGWQFMITQKEVTRLVQLHLDEKANKAPFRHPDLIVTNRFGLVASGRPDRTLYDETFANRHFRIWARKGL